MPCNRFPDIGGNWALTAALKAFKLAQSSNFPESLGWAWRALGQVAVMAPSLRIDDASYTAAKCFAESLRVYKENDLKTEQAVTLKVWAEYELDHGDRTKGEARWREARASFERLQLPLWVERMDRERPKG